MHVQNFYGLNDFPNELLLDILIYLPPSKLVEVARVNKKFKVLCCDSLNRGHCYQLSRQNMELFRSHFKKSFDTISKLYLNAKGELQAFIDRPQRLYMRDESSSDFKIENVAPIHNSEIIESKKLHQIIMVWNDIHSGDHNLGVTTAFGYQIEDQYIKKIREHMLIFANQLWNGSYNIAKLTDSVDKDKIVRWDKVFENEIYPTELLLEAAAIKDV